MMSMYAEIKDGTVLRVGMRPKWFYDDGSPVTDETLAEHGWLPVVRVPQHDPETEVARERDHAEWTVEVDRVLVTYDVSAKPPPSANDVMKERDRRLIADFEFGGKMYQRDQASLQRITGAATLAGFAIANGAQVGDLRWANANTDFAWIASDNSVVTMDAQTCFAFGQAAANVETAIIFAAKTLREMDPIPDPATWEGWP